MGPYPRLCLALLKEAERVNLLHKVRRFALRDANPSPHHVTMDVIPKHTQARVLLEAEKLLVAAAVIQPSDDEAPPSLPSLPCVSFRPVPPLVSCWCVSREWNVASSPSDLDPRSQSNTTQVDPGRQG